MAGIRTSIDLIDNMSQVLKRITGANDRMKNSIESTQERMNQSTNFANNMSNAERKVEVLGTQWARQQDIVEDLNGRYLEMSRIKGKLATETLKLRDKLLSAEMAEIRLAEATEKAEKAFIKQENAKKNIGGNIENATGKQTQFNNEISNGSNAADSLVNKIKGFVGAYLGIRGIKKGFESTVGAAAKLNQQSAIMQAAFGNADIGKQYFNKLQGFAIDARKDMEELTDVTKNFMQVTRNTDKLMGLTKAANRLSMRTGNIAGAESLMQEAMRGEFSRLQRTLHLTDSQIAPLKQAVQKGSLDGIIGAFDQALNTAGLTDDIAEAFQNSPLEKFGKIKDKAMHWLGRAGEEALGNLEGALDKVLVWFDSDSANQFFGAISAGVTLVIDSVMWLGDTVASNWGVIEPILLAISMVYMAQMIAKAWQTAIAFAAMNWPILLVAGTLLVLVKALLQAGVTAEQITGFIGGVFGVLFAYIYNRIAYVWNFFASFAEFLVNLFIDPKYAIEKLFYDLAKNVLAFFNGLFNGIVGGLNWVIEKINGALNSNIGTVKIGVFDDRLAELERNKPTSDKNVWTAPKMEFKDYATEMNKGYEFGKTLPGRFSAGLSNIEDAIAKFSAQEDMWNKNQLDTLGSLDDTGKKIKNSVDKSEEDLKWMRDIAEQEVVNRFTTATLAPQISAYFGDVRETADIDGIITRIEEKLIESMAIAAEGV